MPPRRRTSPLPPAAVQAALAGLPHWTLTAAGHLRRELDFPSFAAAFAFLTAVALRAEAAGHHPEFGCAYRKVWLELWTHDAGGLTQLDLTMARDLEALAGMV